MLYRVSLTGSCLVPLTLLGRPDGIGTNPAHALVYVVRLATDIHSDMCETILCVGNTGLADIAEACQVFHSGWEKRASAPKNMDKVPLDTVLI